MKLMSKYLVVLLGVSLIPVLSLAYLSYRNSRTAIEEATINHLTSINQMKKTEIETWIGENKNTLEILSRNPFFKNGLEDLVAVHNADGLYPNDAHVALCNSYFCPVIQSGYYTELFIIRIPDGLVLVSSNSLQRGKYYENRPFFIEGMKGTYIQNVYYAMSSQIPTMVVSTPLMDSTGKAIAVLAGRVNLERLSMIMEQTSDLNRTEDTYLVNTFNYFVTEPRFGKAYALRKSVYTLGVTEALKKRSGTGFYINYQSDPVIGVYSWIAERNLALITEMSQGEAFKPINTLRVTLITLCLGVVTAVIGISWLASKSLTRPIKGLVRCAQILGKGNLDIRFKITTRDEIGELADAFGQMAEQLKNIMVSKTCLEHEINERKKTEEKLRESELKLRTILDSLRIQVVFLGLDHRIIWVNQAVCDFARCNRESLNGKNCYVLWEGQTERCADCAVERSIIQGQPVMNMRKTANGKIWNVMGCPVMDQDGRIVSMIVVREDITDKVTAEEQFRQAQKMEAVGRLAGGVAHDFNNMLSIIIGFAELCRSSVPSEHPLSDNLNEILSAARRSTDLTRHLLAFARKQPVVPKVLDCNLIIENSRKMLQRLVGEDIDIRFVSCESLWPVHMDPTQIDQILTNLSVNARDAIAGTGTIIIETQNVILDETYCKTHVYAKPGRYVSILFSDSGSGMDEETRLRVFEPFFTTKPLGEGTGLGLSTVFGIIKQNNGMINVYSEPGVGTIFKMYIPRHGVAMKKDDVFFEEACPKGSETILVVEDEKKILKLCKQLLRDLGYRVICFSSPEKTLRYLERTRWNIDLLISDVVMPGMNGDELRQRVEKIRPGIKTLFMSGYTYNVISQRGVMPESLQFIQKPFTLLELATKVRDVLDM